jgi:hypothetical protein
VARRARTQAAWRQRNPDYFTAHRLQQRQLKAEAGTPVAPLVMPRPLSSLPWDLAQEVFGVVGTDFLGQVGRVLLGAAQDQRRMQVVETTGDLGRLPPSPAQDQNTRLTA